MEKISLSKNREHIFQVWYNSSQNDSETVRKLQQDGFNVSRQTIMNWKKKYSWQARADKIDAKKAESSDAALSFEEGLIQDLEKQKKRYDSYFDTMADTEVDNQAMYVYNQLCQKLIDLSAKYKPKAKKAASGLTDETAEEIKKQILGV